VIHNVPFLCNQTQSISIEMAWREDRIQNLIINWSIQEIPLLHHKLSIISGTDYCYCVLLPYIAINIM
jgi:hypothetical protein